MSLPFITFYTPTYRRPQHLARCLESVRVQTAVAEIQHLVVPDHVGLGVGGMYRQVPLYATAVRGQYVHLLADDDELAAPDVVEKLMAFVEERKGLTHADPYQRTPPPVVLVDAEKDALTFPVGQPWPPVQGSIDLGCLVTRWDVWQKHVAAYGAQNRYEGDYDFAAAVAADGHEAVYCDLLFLTGAVLKGKAEVGA